jgi:hypothetical protein
LRCASRLCHISKEILTANHLNLEEAMPSCVSNSTETQTGFIAPKYVSTLPGANSPKFDSFIGSFLEFFDRCPRDQLPAPGTRQDIMSSIMSELLGLGDPYMRKTNNGWFGIGRPSNTDVEAGRPVSNWLDWKWQQTPRFKNDDSIGNIVVMPKVYEGQTGKIRILSNFIWLITFVLSYI